jgi:DNA-binding beta-propeller fold protein YncE
MKLFLSFTVALLAVYAFAATGQLPGMPPVLDPKNIYSETAAGKVSSLIKDYPALVYVPNTKSHTVDVIDQKTFKIVNHFPVGREPQHVTPSWDLKTLWALSDHGNNIRRIDPATGKEHETISVEDPYNMYYSPDGKYAIVVAERMKRLDFHDPQNMVKVIKQLRVPECAGVDHLDFSADGRYFIASCEFAGRLVKVDVAEQKVLGYLDLKKGGMPQDVKVSPDGKVFYVADMMSDGIWMVDGESFTKIGFIDTGLGAHGLYPSRDGKLLYITNRGRQPNVKRNPGEGSISILDFATRKVIKKWVLPGKTSPDMGNVSADGKVLWVSGRYDHEVYAIDTSDGHLIKRIPVGLGPHGLCVYPQPGRYSLGHTGNMR